MASFVLNHPVDIVVVTTDERDPNVLHIDREADVIMVLISAERYVVKKGRWLIGDVTFCNDSAARLSGWRFLPRGPHFRPSRKLHRFPEDAVRRKVRIVRVYGNGSQTIPAY
jgi:hypothetical protein